MSQLDVDNNDAKLTNTFPLFFCNTILENDLMRFRDIGLLNLPGFEGF